MPPAYKPLSLPLKLLLWFVVANAFAGAISLLLAPATTETTFFWNIQPPLSAALFGVLYAAAGVAVLEAVRRGWWENARYLMAMVPAFTGLILVTTLLHLDRFGPGFKLVYWLIIYVVAPTAAVVFYWLHERGGANWQVVQVPVTPAARALAVGFGALLALVTFASYVFPGLVAPLSPFQTSPLMLRIFASWLSSLAAGLLWFLIEPEWTRLRPLTTMLMVTAALGVPVSLLHLGDLKPGLLSRLELLAVFAAVGLVGLALRWLQRSAPASRPQALAAREA